MNKKPTDKLALAYIKYMAKTTSFPVIQGTFKNKDAVKHVCVCFGL